MTLPVNSPLIVSPRIEGTPSGSGMPKVTLKQGDGGGAYTSVSATFADVDSTNLAYSDVIPAGWKLLVIAKCNGFSSTTSSNLTVQLFDTGTGTLLDRQTLTTAVAASTTLGYSLEGVIEGDGGTHSIVLQFATGVAPNQVNITNASGDTPKMLCILMPIR